MRILVSKLGAVLRTQESGSLSRGERGETEGLIRHLVASGHKVLYFGSHRGRLPCPAQQAHLWDPQTGEPLNENSRWEAQEECWRLDERLVRDQFGEFDLAILVNGSTATFSIRNPSGCRVRAVDVQRHGPVVALVHNLKIPVVSANNDPRTYARNWEMSVTWPDTRPVALLDNWSGEKLNGVGGVKYLRRSCHAWSESWGTDTFSDALRGPTLAAFRDDKYVSSVIVAQAHLQTGVRQEGRARGWETVLRGACEALPDLGVHGDGWRCVDALRGWSDRVKPGVSSLTAMSLYANAYVSPMVGYEENRSGKGYMIAAAGCVPLCYGDGSDPHSWDRTGQVVPLDHPTRITRPGDLARLARRETWEEHMPFMLERFVARWDVLDACLDEIAAGRHRDDPATFFERYGGYQEVGRY